MDAQDGGKPGFLDRAIEYAAQNLRVEKVLIQLGLDPSNVTFDAFLNCLVDIILANINVANTLALVGAMLYVATLMVRTIVPLRILGIISMLFFIGYGALAGAVATFLLYLLSLPDQHLSPPSDAQSCQKSSRVRAGRPVDGLAQAVS